MKGEEEREKRLGVGKDGFRKITRQPLNKGKGVGEERRGKKWQRVSKGRGGGGAQRGQREED